MNTSSIAHARHLCKQLNRVGISVRLVNGKACAVLQSGRILPQCNNAFSQYADVIEGLIRSGEEYEAVDHQLEPSLTTECVNHDSRNMQLPYPLSNRQFVMFHPKEVR